jgi:trehalose-phosphatase
VGLDEIYYAGSHGLRLAGPDGWSSEHEEARRFLPAIDDAERRLAKRLAALDGVQVERKRFAVAVHFRRAAPGAERELRSVAEAVREELDGLRFGEGRKVLELRPDIDWDKGAAVERLLQELGLARSRVFPIYIGDDVTDEDAFEVVGAWGDRRGNGGAGSEPGLAIAVRGRRGRTRAALALEDTDAVRRFLRELDAELAR